MSEEIKQDGEGRKPTPPTTKPPSPPKEQNGAKKGGKQSQTDTALSEDEFWLTVRTISTKASREQQLELARLISGLLGANVSFPSARENRLLQEVKAASSAKQNNPKGPRAKKPENAALKNSAEYKEFVSAEKALREAKAKLSIPKNDKSDPRVKQEAEAFENARTKFLDLKKSSKTQ